MTRIGSSKADRSPSVGEAGRVGRIYSRYADSARKRRAWAADNPGNVAIRNELLAHLHHLSRGELDGAGRILDLGCGSGWWLRALGEAGVATERLAGVDILPSRVAAARRAVPGARIIVADARRLAFPNRQFSLVLLLTVLSSLGSAVAVHQVLTEARRVLAPGGLLLCYEPRIRNPLNRRTRRIRDADLDAAGLEPRQQITLTLFPWLARRLGARAPDLYPPLSRLRPLRTHRLVAYREYARDTHAQRR